MAAMTWDTLTADKTADGSIKRWLNNSLIDPEEVIAEAEDFMALFLRTNLMKVRVEPGDDFILSEGASDYNLDALNSLPTNLTVYTFLDPVNFFLVGQGRLAYVAEDEIDAMRWPDPDDPTSINTGTPTRYTIVNRTMLFDVEADDDYIIVGSYYGRPIALSAAHQTSIYTTNYRMIFKQALLGAAYQLPKEASMQDFHYKKALSMIGQQKVMDDLMLRTQEQSNRVNY